MPPRKRPRRFPLSWQGMLILSEGVRDQPCAAGRKHYWIVNPRSGDKRKTTGASEGDRSQALPCGRSWDFNRPATARLLKEVNSPQGHSE